ncbi:MAG: AraC family transcriptional regulator [Paenibacillaceae bacterium]|jgi:AraC-like DNA-binding protein|nr:AraC family transcriptional regulator [Paenibacillaceae bacterium]
MSISTKLSDTLLESLTIQVTHAQFKQGYPDWKRMNETPAFDRIYYLSGGEGMVIINGHTYHPRPGQLFILPAGTTQTTSTSEENPYTRHFCHFNAKIGAWSLFQSANQPFITSVRDPGKTAEAFNELIAQFCISTPIARLRTQALLLQLIAQCLEEGGYSDFMKYFLQSDERDKLTRVMAYIEAHLGQPIGVDELAALIHFHPNYFIPYFKKHMGMTPMAYVQRKRMEEAKRLLSFSQHSVSEIADSLGMELTHFSKQFKHTTGLSPTAYREYTS